MDEAADRPHLEIMADLAIELETRSTGEWRVIVAPAESFETLNRLRDRPETAMGRLVDLTAVDRGGVEERFEVVYRLHSPGHGQTCFVHVRLDAEEPILDSATALWPAANWLEREVFDLFGIRFRSHPDLRRILLEPDFEGAPLRKDYPRQPHLPLPRAEAP